MGGGARLTLLATLVLAAPANGEEELLGRLGMAGCELVLEAHARWHTLRLRARGEDCAARADAAAVARLLDASLPASAVGGHTSLMLGRIVEYGWLSAALREAAAADPGWDAAAGRPRSGHENDRVAALLHGAPALAPIADALARAGLAVSGTSVEKVLVDGAPGRRLPFDAQLWLLLEPCPAAGCRGPGAL